MAHANRPTLETFRISPEEAQSRLWMRFAQHLRGHLEHLREKNDSTALGIAETTVMRGEIRLTKQMLALADEAGPASRLPDDETDLDAMEQFVPPLRGRF